MRWSCPFADAGCEFETESSADLGWAGGGDDLPAASDDIGAGSGVHGGV
jgi:hypothetical protein